MSKEEFLKKLIEHFNSNFGDSERTERSWWLDVGTMAEHKWAELYRTHERELAAEMVKRLQA